MARSNDKHLGRAVLDGKLRYTSVSAVDKFDETQDGGCNRKFYFRFVEGKKEPQKKSAAQGVNLHSELESYLKTGDNVLSPITLAGKHLLPAPGSDLILEAEFGDVERALKMVDTGSPATEDLKKVAGLAASGVPLIGFIDVRHARGEYVDSEGNLRRESRDGVQEVIDHKTTSSIDDYAKRPTELLETIQMVGYAEHVFTVAPETRFVRLSHIYYQTRGAKSASKRTVLVGPNEIHERWHRIEGVVDKMKEVVRLPSVNEVTPNLSACDAYGGCSYRLECPKSPIQIAKSLFGPTRGGGNMSLLSKLKGTPAVSNVNTETVSTTSSAASETGGAAVTMSASAAAERRAAVEAEKKKLLDEDEGKIPVTACDMDQFYVVDGKQMQFIGASKGFYFFKAGEERIKLEGTAYVKEIPAGTSTTSAPVAAAAPAKETVGQVNPPDAPKYDLTENADPLPPDVIAQITDPELKVKAEAHAKIHAERKAAAEAAAAANKAKADEGKEGGGRCPEGKKRIICTQDQIATKEYKCSCGKTLKLKLGKNEETGAYEATLPGHNLPKAEETAPVTTPASSTPATPASNTPASTTPASTSSTPATPATTSSTPASTSAPTSTPATAAPVTPQTIADGIREVAKMIEESAPRTTVPGPFVAFNDKMNDVVIFVDVTVEGADGLKPLENYFTPLLRDIEREYAAVDIRLAPKDSPIAYGGWKGLLAALVRDKKPEAGAYSIVRPSEIAEVVIEALKPTSIVVRGVR